MANQPFGVEKVAELERVVVHDVGADVVPLHQWVPLPRPQQLAQLVVVDLVEARQRGEVSLGQVSKYQNKKPLGPSSQNAST